MITYRFIQMDHFPTIQQELLALRQKSVSYPAYPNLVEQSGVWDMLQLYVGRQWNQDACALMPSTAALLQQHLPSTDVPYIHYNSEEVVVLDSAEQGDPGRKPCERHNGGSNVPVNLSLGLAGCGGSFCEVAGEVKAFEDGKVLAFDDGSDHRVWHDGKEERWVLTLRQLHPELQADPQRYFCRAFTWRTCFEAWDEGRARALGCGENGVFSAHALALPLACLQTPP
eukprot:s3796_g2.t2